MSESDDRQPGTEQAAADDNGPLAGERLARARRDKQISVDEIAKELHIDEYKVRALERNDFEVLGPPVFAKGHLRKYAQLVGVRVEDILGDYYELNRSVGPPPLVARVRPELREVNLGRWLIVLLLLLVAGGAYWWFVERDAPQQPANGTGDAPAGMPVAEPEPQESRAAEEGAPTADGGETTSPVAAATEAPAELSTQVTGDAAEPPPRPPGAAAGEVQLAVTYSGDCWTEITDAQGQRLFFGLGKSGRTVSVSGAAPLSVLFGNADHVALQVNGASYTITPGQRRGLTARFSIPAP